MDPTLILVNAITLLYKESHIQDGVIDSGDLVRNAVNALQLPDIRIDLGFNHTRDILNGLRSTALWLCDNKPELPYDAQNFLQRIRLNTAEDHDLYQVFEQSITQTTDLESLKRQCAELRTSLRIYLSRIQIQEVLKRRSREANYQGDTKITSWTDFVADTIRELEPLQVIDGGVTAGFVEDVDFTNSESLTRTMREGLEEQTSTSVMRMGLQALERMLGDVGGLRLGETVLFAALQHQFKSGILLLIFKWLCIYNKPVQRKPNKKPMILFVTFENEPRQNVLQLYMNLWENEHKQVCNPHDIDLGEAAAYIKEKLSVNGYHPMMIRINGSDATYQSFFEQIEKLERDGYDVQAVVTDYLNLISKRGLQGGAQGQDIRELFRRTRNYFSAKRILHVTAHQLSTEAKMLVRQGMAEDFVKEIAGKGYYDSCRTIDQEVDLEIYIHIVHKAGRAWLTFQRGKHRKPKPTPPQHLYFAVPFDVVGTIPDDINSQDRSAPEVGIVPGHDGTDSDGGDWWKSNNQTSSSDVSVDL